MQVAPKQATTRASPDMFVGDAWIDVIPGASR